MKVIFLMPGKEPDEALDKLIKNYESRITHFIHYESKVLSVSRIIRSGDSQQIRQKESDLIRNEFLPGDFIVLLDERGLEMGSVEFSGWIRKKMNASPRRMVFVCGGAYGVDSMLMEMANEKISLGKMTLPHQLVRLVFSEQLYRAFTLLHGQKYHHE